MKKREITITLQEQSFVIKFPNMGQIVDVEVYKANLAKGQYGTLVGTMSKSALIALDFVDAAATFLVLIPELQTRLSVESLTNLDPIEAQELVVQYKKVFFPWYSKIVTALQLKEEELSKVYEVKDDES
jgi:hypothetical protein